MLVIGTRPEAIKLAPVAKALGEIGLPPHLVATGQHPDLDLESHGLADFDSERLNCRGKTDPHAHVGDVDAALRRVLGRHTEVVTVQGDTSSALGGARAADALGIPFAHVEAGLRSHDPALPWPEEEYRVEIDSRAELLFAPTDLSAGNLAREQVAGEIHVTGNTSVDALLHLLDKLPPAASQTGRPRILVTCHRRESWGDGLASVMAAVRRLAAGSMAEFRVLLHPNRHVADQIRTALAGCEGVELLRPCGHAAMVQHMRASRLILSDSGGIQEEAPALGVPLLVLRDKTERPEGIATGNMRLVGTDTDRIVREAEALLADPDAHAAMARPAFPYGDGRAAPRIAAIVAEWLAHRPRRRERA